MERAPEETSHQRVRRWPSRVGEGRAISDLHAPGLDVVDLCVRYAGHLSVSNLTLSAPLGRITGLIGPNGAGKTTTFNACSGFTRPFNGRVVLFGQDVTRLSAAARARRGLGRTFQRMELFTSMTVAENVALGREARMAGSNPIWQQISTRRQRALVRDATAEALEVCGIAGLANSPVEGLPTGQRRLVELARVIAGDYRLLLLDEPSSGLDPDESTHLGEVLCSLVGHRNLGILLVEHDMALAMGICGYLHVLDFGRLIFEGTASEAQASPTVRAVYLGAEDLETEMVGPTSAGGA